VDLQDPEALEVLSDPALRFLPEAPEDLEDLEVLVDHL
jgi:hypothetical protein